MTIPAFRYVDGRIVPCDWERMRVRLPPPCPPAFVAAFPARRIALGVFAADLAREERLPGGPPTWFKPNGSRRGRWVAWGALSPTEQETRNPFPAFEPDHLQVEEFERHLFRSGHRDRLTGRDVIDREVALYLPSGERPTERHGRDIERAMREMDQPRARQA